MIIGVVLVVLIGEGLKISHVLIITKGIGILIRRMERL
jgi:hypothetical protein